MQEEHHHTGHSHEHIENHLLELKEKLNETISISGDSSSLSNLKQEVEQALRRIDDGTFGVCEVCKDMIEDDYLESDPLVKSCFTHLSDAEKLVIERDLDLAYKVQSHLLPALKFDFPDFEISCHYEPHGSLSGDFYDVVKTDKGIFFLFGDVSGKGISAALLMSNLNAIFRTLVEAKLPLKELIETANRLFSKSTLPSHYATLVCGSLSSSGELEIGNAGHCLPLIIRKAEVLSIESTGVPVGIYLGAEYSIRKYRLEAGDVLFLYTDGLSETRNAAGEEYGEQRLSALLEKIGCLSTKEIIKRVLEEVTAFRAAEQKTDDLTIMAVRRSS